MTNNQKKLGESITRRVFKMLLERFGEPIVDPQQSVGIHDEGPDGKKTYRDGTVDGPWNRPNVVKETYVKPQYKGKFIGQTWTTNDQVKYQRIVTVDKMTGEKKFILVPRMKKVTLVWNGNDWIEERDFNLQMSKSPAANPGGKESVADFMRRGGKIKRIG